MHYLVTWDIDVDADNPQDAAIEARKTQLYRPDSVATVFVVEDDNGVKVTIDLEDL